MDLRSISVCVSNVHYVVYLCDPSRNLKRKKSEHSVWNQMYRQDGLRCAKDLLGEREYDAGLTPVKGER